MNIFNEAETWVAIAFILFLLVIIRFGWNKITESLDLRAEQIKSELNEARNLREKAQALLADYQRKKRDSEEEASNIIANAKEEAKTILEETNTRLKETLERRSLSANEKFSRAYASALQDLHNAAVDIAIDTSKKIIIEKNNESASEKIINDGIKAIDKNIL